MTAKSPISRAPARFVALVAVMLLPIEADGEISLREFSAFQRAFAGPNCQPVSTQWDNDRNGCVDLHDWAGIAGPTRRTPERQLNVALLNSDGMLVPESRIEIGGDHKDRRQTGSDGLAHFAGVRGSKFSLRVVSQGGIFLTELRIPASAPLKLDVILQMMEGGIHSEILPAGIPKGLAVAPLPVGYPSPTTPFRRDTTAAPALNAQGDIGQTCNSSLYANVEIDDDATSLSTWRAEDGSVARWIVDDVTLNLDATITNVHWLGNEPVTYNWSGGLADLIILRADGVNGGPGSVVVDEASLPASRHATGMTLFGDPVWRYDLFDLNITLTAGSYWIGMRTVQSLPLGQSPSDGGWWVTSKDNGSSGVYVDFGFNEWDPGSDPFLFGEELQVAFCVVGFDGQSPYGACCSEADASCTDCVQGLCHPPARFAPNTSCDDLDPPCGQALGACCDLTAGGCTITTNSDCLAGGGAFQSAASSCDAVDCPCVVSCATTSLNEGEPDCFDGYVDLFNAGCASTGATFSPIACGDSLCAASGTFSGSLACAVDEDCPPDFPCLNGFCDGGPYSVPDEDWYQIHLSEPAKVTWRLEAEFPIAASIHGLEGGGCDVASPLVPIADECRQLQFSKCLSPGDWALQVSPNEQSLCGSTYTLNVSCAACPIGACCASDGSCRETIEPDCDADGIWLSSVDSCAPATCPQPPENETCDSAVLLDIGETADADNTWGMTDEVPECGGALVDQGLWFEVVGTGGTLTASTCFDETTIDSALQVFCGCSEPVCVTGSAGDASCENGATATWCSEAGRSYLIHAGGNGGPFRVSVTDDGETCSSPALCLTPIGACCADQQCIGTTNQAECFAQSGSWHEGRTCEGFTCPEPLADECPDATMIPDVPFRTTIDTSAASASGPEGSCNSVLAQEMLNDAWLAYTAPSDCMLSVRVDPTLDEGYDALVAVYTGNDCQSLGEVSCADEPQPIELTVVAQAGQTYWIQVGDWGLFPGGGLTGIDVDCSFLTGACCDGSGNCKETVESDCIDGLFSGNGTNCQPNLCPQVPDNDFCTEAQQLAVPGSIVGNTTLAAGPSTVAPCGPATANHALWYAITGTGNRIDVSTCNPTTDFDTVIQVWCGNCEQPVCVTGNDDDANASPACALNGLNRKSTASFCSELNATYLVAVGGFGEAVGTVEIRAVDAAPCSDATDCRAQYCQSGADSANDSLCARVRLNELDQDTSDSCASYSDFTAMETEVVQGAAYDLTVTADTCGACFDMWVEAYIDWNRDLDFDDFGEEYILSAQSTSACPQEVSAVVVVPDEAVLGATRLRVVVHEGGSSLETAPCGIYGWGETEDYSVLVMEGDPRSPGTFEDLDGDAVPDLCDNCPSVANTNQRDDDGDEVGDECDNCPDHPNGPATDNQMDTDGDLVGDVCDICPLDNPDDTDLDGVCDSNDRCAGFPDSIDSDRDGVPDACDRCRADVGPTGNDSLPGATGDDDQDGYLNCNDICAGANDDVFGACPDAIPASSTWGLIVLALLLLVGAKTRAAATNAGVH